MQAFLLLWTVAAVGLALTAPLVESATAAEYTMASDASRFGKRGMKEDRADALDTVVRCLYVVSFSSAQKKLPARSQAYRTSSWQSAWGTDDMDPCIKQHNAEKYRLSAKEVTTQFAEFCKPRARPGLRPNCAEMADIIFRANDRQHPSGFRRMAKIMNHGVKTTGSALVRAAQRTAGRASSWAKSLFNRPSAFQSPVRGKEGAAVMHPIRPVFVQE
ncbi:MAG: hypothetical protein M1826_006323 [Phylliscum demangeonii]|nr:MAG: hypothetical protein M1826_006323 [Phylliscum demangeonii]